MRSHLNSSFIILVAHHLQEAIVLGAGPGVLPAHAQVLSDNDIIRSAGATDGVLPNSNGACELAAQASAASAEADSSGQSCLKSYAAKSLAGYAGMVWRARLGIFLES